MGNKKYCKYFHNILNFIGKISYRLVLELEPIQWLSEFNLKRGRVAEWLLSLSEYHFERHGSAPASGGNTSVIKKSK